MSNNGHKIFGRGMSPASLSRTFKIDVPGTDYCVMVRELSAAELEGLPQDIYAQLAMLIVDETGERVFTDPQDATLKQFSYGVMRHIITEATRLNGATAEAIDAALKNSAADLSTASVSDSQPISE